MAMRPQARAPQASAEDDFYGEDELDIGTDDLREERTEGESETAGTTEHTGEGDPEFEEEDELLAGDEEPPQPRRGEGRLQRLANERNEYRRRVEELEAQQRPAPQTGPKVETDLEFNNRISLLSPEERMEARHERWMQQQTAQNQRQQFENANARDRAEFQAFCKTDKRAARMAAEVEREFEKSVRAGNPAPRMNILRFLAGSRMFDSEPPPAMRRAREAAQRRVERQTVRPASGGSDVRASRRERTDERTARARRLEGQQI